MGCLAGEVGLQVQQHAGDWDALACITLALPVIALSLILGLEHAHGDLGRAQRLGMMVAVLLAVACIMYNSVIRTAGALDSTLAQGDRVVKHADEVRGWRDEQTKTASNLHAQASDEAKRGGCKAVCNGLLSQAKDAEEKARQYEQELSKAVIEPAALGFAAVSEATHIDARVLSLYQPMALPLALQFAVIFAGSVAFGPSRRRAMVTDTKPNARPALVVNNDEHPVISALRKRGGQVNSNEELGEMLSVSRGQSSKLVGKLETAGLVTRERAGKNVVIRLVS